MSHIVADEVEVVAWSDSHCSPSPLGQPGVSLVQSLVYIHKGIDAGLAVGGWSRELWVCQGDHVRWNVLQER